jgi:hypothetical protein
VDELRSKQWEEVSRRADEHRAREAEKRAKREAEEAAWRAEREEVERKKRQEKLEQRKGGLLSFSAGRTVGVEETAETAAVDRLARESYSIETLQSCFEWCAQNGGDVRLGWSVVDDRYTEWCIAQVRRTPPRRWPGSGDRRGRNADVTGQAARLVSLPSSNPVFQAMVSACGFSLESCSERDRSDLSEAFGSYTMLSRGMPADDRVAELESFAEWFGSGEGRRPGPMEIVNRLHEFRGRG